MKKVISILLVIFCFSSLISCSSKNNFADKLPQKEYELYSVIKDNLSMFKHPSSVGITYASTNGQGIVYVHIIARNDFDSFKEEKFFAFTKTYVTLDGYTLGKKGDLIAYSDLFDTIGRLNESSESKLKLTNDLTGSVYSYDLSLINDALDELTKD